MRSVVELASQRAKAQKKLNISPQIFLEAYRQVAENNPDVRYGFFRDTHWTELRNLLPSFNLEQGNKLDKLKNAVMQLHPSKDDVEDDIEEVKMTASDRYVLKRIKELEKRDLNGKFRAKDVDENEDDDEIIPAPEEAEDNVDIDPNVYPMDEIEQNEEIENEQEIEKEGEEFEDEVLSNEELYGEIE